MIFPARPVRLAPKTAALCTGLGAVLVLVTAFGWIKSLGGAVFRVSEYLTCNSAFCQEALPDFVVLSCRITIHIGQVKKKDEG